MGFGQGALLVSPLQMALVGATIANGGRRAAAATSFARSCATALRAASVSKNSTLANPVSADTAAKVTQMMVAVVQRGTGTPAQIPHVKRGRKDGHGNKSARAFPCMVRLLCARRSSPRGGSHRRRKRGIRRNVRRADRPRRAPCRARKHGQLASRARDRRARFQRSLSPRPKAWRRRNGDGLLRNRRTATPARVAIKVLRDQYAADDEFVRRFYQKAESAARLSHPNIVNTFDMGRQDDTYFIVMELVDGPSLAEIIAADGRLPEPVAIDLATQIASDGLAYAHRQGLLHRDASNRQTFWSPKTTRRQDFRFRYLQIDFQTNDGVYQTGLGDGQRLLYFNRASARAHRQ